MKICIVSDSHAVPIGMQAGIHSGQCRLVNPGSVAGIDAPGVDDVPTWILGDLAQMTFEIRTWGILATDERGLRQQRGKSRAGRACHPAKKLQDLAGK